MSGCTSTMFSPSSVTIRRSTPCVLGCCGPMFSMSSSVRRAVPILYDNATMTSSAHGIGGFEYGGLNRQRMQLQGKVAVVTGAASGINRAIAARFAVEGADVIAADIDESGGREVVAGITPAGGRAIAVRTDVRRRDEVEAMVRRAV